jgi:hypothetical protein
MNNFLIPANVKRGQYIFGLFRPVDLIIFGVGLFTTLILVAIMPMEQTWAAVLSVIPGIVCSLLVAPVAYYHNMLQLIIEIYQFFTERRIYVWKGWCILDESTESKQMDRKLD